jgi:hypothetical protein
MNKSDVIKELSKRTGYSEEKCITINSIVEDIFIVGKKNKEKMIDEIKEKLDVDKQKANNIYETFMDIIGTGIKDKLKHPFKSND